MKDFSNSEGDPEYAKGEFVLPDFRSKRNSLEEYYCSSPIIVDGVCYRAKIYHKGCHDAMGTSISFGICMSRISSLNIDTDNNITVIRKILHASDRERDVEEVSKYHRKNLDNYTFVRINFFKLADLEKDGFIHGDGSLRFEFLIKRQNFKKRLMKTDLELEQAVT